jgi:hypothetical protein
MRGNIRYFARTICDPTSTLFDYNCLQILINICNKFGYELCILFTLCLLKKKKKKRLRSNFTTFNSRYIENGEPFGSNLNIGKDRKVR